MIKISNEPYMEHCNCCFDGVAVVDIKFQLAGGAHSSSFTLCKNCLAELADVSRQAHIAIEQSAPAGEEQE